VSRTRRALGWLLAVVGVVLIVVGVACAVLVGPDSAVSSGEHRLSSQGATIVTGDDTLDQSGPTVDISVTTPDGGPVFVGLANAVDVHDYLAGSPVTRVDSVSLPWTVETTEVDGRSAPLVDPSDVDWWLVSDSGEGSASISFPLPDEVVDVVIMDPGRGGGFAADVTVDVEVPGLFVGAIAVAVFGLGLLLGARLVLRARPSPTAGGDDTDRTADDTSTESTDADGPQADVIPS
jgi:hypothetical protein